VPEPWSPILCTRPVQHQADLADIITILAIIKKVKEVHVLGTKTEILMHHPTRGKLKFGDELDIAQKIVRTRNC
jgi:hypothetical protein